MAQGIPERLRDQGADLDCNRRAWRCPFVDVDHHGRAVDIDLSNQGVCVLDDADASIGSEILDTIADPVDEAGDIRPRRLDRPHPGPGDRSPVTSTMSRASPTEARDGAMSSCSSRASRTRSRWIMRPASCCTIASFSSARPTGDTARGWRCAGVGVSTPSSSHSSRCARCRSELVMSMMSVGCRLAECLDGREPRHRTDDPARRIGCHDPDIPAAHPGQRRRR